MWKRIKALWGGRKTSAVQLTDVFGLVPDRNPHSYVKRQIEDAVVGALRRPQFEVVVLHGTSKQGKSSLIRNVFSGPEAGLPNTSAAIVECSAESTTEALYRELLNVIDFYYDVERGQSTVTDFKYGLPVLGGSEQARIDQRAVRPEVHLSNGKTVAGYVRKYSKVRFVIFDNFHFLNKKTQESIAIDVRSFSSVGIKIVLLSTWKFQDFINTASTDLTGKIAEFSVEPWDKTELLAVIAKGSREYNIEMSPKITNFLVQSCHGNIGLLQTLCYELVQSKYLLFERPAKKVKIDDIGKAQSAEHVTAKGIVDQVATGLILIMRIGPAYHLQHSRMAWIMRSFLESDRDGIINGIRYGDLFECTNALLKRHRARQITPDDFGTLVKLHLLKEQQRPGRTPVIAYNGLTDEVVILDSWFKFVLRLNRQNLLPELWKRSER